MLQTRFSVREDVPVLRHLWQTVFGDTDEYIDNFFQTCYTPERGIVTEEDGEIRSMVLWFDMPLVIPGNEPVHAPYLYALATDPNHRGKGIAGKMLADADELLRGLGYSLVTTVPAEPTLHLFFGTNGFHECFVHAEYPMTPAPAPYELPGVSLEKVTPGEYTRVREELLADTPRIIYDADTMAYQQGACDLSGGCLYVGKTPAGPVCLCVERTNDNRMMAKELLGGHDARMFITSRMAKLAPNLMWLVRCPVKYAPPGAQVKKFGMLKWLDPGIRDNWDYESTAYMGLAFD